MERKDGCQERKERRRGGFKCNKWADGMFEGARYTWKNVGSWSWKDERERDGEEEGWWKENQGGSEKRRGGRWKAIQSATGWDKESFSSSERRLGKIGKKQTDADTAGYAVMQFSSSLVAMFPRQRESERENSKLEWTLAEGKKEKSQPIGKTTGQDGKGCSKERPETEEAWLVNAVWFCVCGVGNWDHHKHDLTDDEKKK